MENIFKIQDVFNIGGKTVVSGTLLSGIIKVQMKTNINGKSCPVVAIERGIKSLDYCDEVHSQINLVLDNVSKEEVQSYDTLIFE
jgi:translation elongation factor EF-Tu-like GTPase